MYKGISPNNKIIVNVVWMLTQDNTVQLINGPFNSSGGQKRALTALSNTWKHACYCAFMYTFA